MKYNVLIVDDEPMVLCLLKCMVENISREYSTETVIDTHTESIKALDSLATKEYNMIISDITMPNIDGVELIKIIEKEKLATNALKYLVSGYAIDNLQSEVKIFQESNIIQGFIKKPFEISAIKKIYQNMIISSLSDAYQKQHNI